MNKAVCIGALFALSMTAGVTAADWKLTGSWRLTVSCSNFDQVNTLSISEATTSRVLGTTNVGDGFGKVVGGAFDGENFAFSNQYKWDGTTYTEQWKGKLSRNGNYLRGKFTTSNKSSGGCSFRGGRL